MQNVLIILGKNDTNERTSSHCVYFEEFHKVLTANLLKDIAR